MHKLKTIVSLLLFMAVTTGNAQTVNASKKDNAVKKKKGGKLIKAHRGTIVLNIHEKVGRQAQAQYASMPKLGSIVSTLPAGAAKVAAGTDSFYYKNGLYYLPKAKGFQLVLPVPGIRIQGLPIGYRRVMTGEKLYFYYYGTFYSQVGSTDNYEVVTAPEGAVVNAIPDGYKIEKIENVEYYLLGDTYYAEIDATNMENKIGYEVVTIIQAYQVF
jgi:hypothetical protein